MNGIGACMNNPGLRCQALTQSDVHFASEVTIDDQISNNDHRLPG